MCEFNQRMVMPPIRSCHSEGPLYEAPIDVPPSPWADRAAQLPEVEAALIAKALEEAVELECDVHIYRRVGSLFLGLALKPSQYNKSMILEYPTIS
jgi:hypothetical protein